MSLEDQDSQKMDTDGRAGGNVTTEAETRVVQAQREEQWQLLEGDSPRAHGTRHTRTSDFWPPEL